MARSTEMTPKRRSVRELRNAHDFAQRAVFYAMS